MHPDLLPVSHAEQSKQAVKSVERPSPLSEAVRCAQDMLVVYDPEDDDNQYWPTSIWADLHRVRNAGRLSFLFRVAEPGCVGPPPNLPDSSPPTRSCLPVSGEVPCSLPT